MIKGINHITFTVSNIDRSQFFYRELLGAKLEVVWDTGAYLSIGDSWLCFTLGEPEPSNDYSHIALDTSETEFELICERLNEANVKQWQKNSSEGKSFYFLDPDGHKLEVHVGNIETRLKSLKITPYKGLRWF